jgi:hypothetical protein
MSAHLSSEQISRWMAGNRNPADVQHMRKCAQCAAEADRLGALLQEFRSAVVSWSALQEEADVPNRWQPLERRRSFSGSRLRWTMATAALAIAVAVPIGKNACDRQREAEAFRADAKLWEQVNTQVSRAVPTPLEPLLKLVAWEPAISQMMTVK